MFPARGLFALAPDSPPDLAEFRDYWKNTDVRGSNNGWLREYYQQTLGCRIPGKRRGLYPILAAYGEPISDDYNPNFASLPVCPDEATYTLGDVDPDIVVDPLVVSTIDGVYAYAVALKKAWESKCRGRPGLCQPLVQMSHEVSVLFF